MSARDFTTAGVHPDACPGPCFNPDGTPLHGPYELHPKKVFATAADVPPALRHVIGARVRLDSLGNIIRDRHAAGSISTKDMHDLLNMAGLIMNRLTAAERELKS